MMQQGFYVSESLHLLGVMLLAASIKHTGLSPSPATFLSFSFYPNIVN